MEQLSPEQQILRVCQQLHHKNMLASADGNISMRIDAETIMITPSGVPKAMVNPEDMALVHLDGTVIKGKPSSEKLMHLTVYNKCPEAKAVVHAHPPNAIAWSVSSPELKELPSECLSEVILAAGRIPFVPYARPGSQQMGDVLLPYLEDCRLMILSRHGALSWGESMQEAYNGMERLEHSAQILRYAKSMGPLTFLPEDEVLALREMRKKIGKKTL